MDLNNIERLINILEGSSVKNFTYKDEEMEISISTLDNPPATSVQIASPMGAHMSGMAPIPQEIPASVTTEVAEVEEEDYEYITSPIVATFYAAPAPDMPHFVNVGDHVKEGQTLCILEAMKVMNEIPADFNCEIESVLVSNEQRVEYGQPLFRVKKI